ncbi:coiled-coil domain-containing protein [Flexibacterium corallicola]|uniref:hypothetical protein n=1 Tax=Flexibacterium corallicola TaxID=3037259 RepID=UPI00286F48DE|nr:hypothetical protein [Pseudovibrio sp. M1P-2-3]
MLFSATLHLEPSTNQKNWAFCVIEKALYIGLGVLTASLLYLALLPLFWARAVRLTKKAIEASNPVSYARNSMARDHMRAQFAIERRQLEASLDVAHERLTKTRAALNVSEAQSLAQTEEIRSLRNDLALAKKKGGLKLLRKRKKAEGAADLDFSAIDAEAGSAQVIQLRSEQPMPAEPETQESALAALASAISKEVEEISSESHRIYSPTSPEEAVEKASEAFNRLKDKYSAIQEERDQLRQQISHAEQPQGHAPAQEQPEAFKQQVFMSHKNIDNDHQNESGAEMQALLDDLTRKISSFSEEGSTGSEHQALREELQQVAAKLAAHILDESTELPPRLNQLVEELDTAKTASSSKLDKSPTEQISLVERISNLRKAGGH